MIEVAAGDRVVLGRAGPFASLFASHDNVSGTHALLSVSQDGSSVSIVDLRSTNGTFVDSVRATPGADLLVSEAASLRLASNVELRLEKV